MKAHLNIADGGDSGRHVSEPYGEVIVTLSRRNVLSLLHKLERDDEEGVEAARTLMRMTEDNLLLTIVVEKDEQHYGERPPGEMGSDIETKLAREDRERREDEDALARFDAGE